MGYVKNRIPRASQQRAICQIKADKAARPPLKVLFRRPISVLALVPTPVVLFVAGAFAGVVGKTVVAPLDRVKILLQVRGGLQKGAVREAAVRGGVFRSLWAILHDEGVLGFWKGNLPQLLRVAPYSAVQLGSYEVFKRLLSDDEGELTVWRRLIAGAAAGMCSTFATYPLDTLRFRLAVDPEATTVRQACRMLFEEGGIRPFYRGLKPALLGIAPYMALELGSYDSLPSEFPSFLRGVVAALIATSFCYPLDTMRRVGQLVGAESAGYRQIVRRIWEQDGLGGFYRGFLPNAIKNLPNKGIRLSTFDAVKRLFVVSQAAYLLQLETYHETKSAMNQQDVDKVGQPPRHS